MASFKLTSLPPELHLLVSSYLAFPDYVNLKTTCSYFYKLIPTLTHAQLLDAETTDFAVARDLYACRYCRRLRPAGAFADRMLCQGRGRRGRNAKRRFCVNCGLQPRGEDGEARYGRGAMIVIRGRLYGICNECRRFGPGFRADGGRLRCKMCFCTLQNAGPAPGVKYH
ncbi:hypothetical protein BDW62DRAFT_203176 [Aspergillus aurantiobrunneus]